MINTIFGGRNPAKEGPVFVAEISANHAQSLDRAIELIHVARDIGADAVKLQTYSASEMTVRSSSPDFIVTDWSPDWDGKSMYELYDAAHTPREWHSTLFKESESAGIVCFSSPFSPTGVDFLQDLGCPAYKIASFENNDVELLEAVGSTGKPVVISTGASDLPEIFRAIEIIRSCDAGEVVLLHCTSAYPAPHDELNLNAMHTLASASGCPVGFSDHSEGIGAAVAAATLGAFMIEKHLTLEDDEITADSHFSLRPDEFQSMIVESKRAVQSLGGTQIVVSQSELGNRKEKRSLFFRSDLPEGTVLDRAHVVSLRPRTGLEPIDLSWVEGRPLKSAVGAGEPVTANLFG